MQNLTGSAKKIMAGIACVLSLFFSALSCASNSTAATSSQSSAAAESATAAQLPAVEPSTLEQQTATQPTVELASGKQPSVEQPFVERQAPSYSSAAPVKTHPVPAKTNSASQLASLIGGLALILVLIYGLSWFVKRFSQGGFMQNSTMKVIAAMPLGTRERLMLVEIGGKQLLLGVTATQINSLHVFDEPVVLPEKEQPMASDFSQKLMAILQQKNTSSAAGSKPDKKSNS